MYKDRKIGQVGCLSKPVCFPVVEKLGKIHRLLNRLLKTVTEYWNNIIPESFFPISNSKYFLRNEGDIDHRRNDFCYQKQSQLNEMR